MDNEYDEEEDEIFAEEPKPEDLEPELVNQTIVIPSLSRNPDISDKPSRTKRVNYDANMQYGNLKRKLDKYKDHPLTDADIRQLMGNQCNIVRYQDIKKYNSIKQLLGPHECCFILYEWQPRSGHWCLLTKHKNLVEFFDPYSGMPDSELDQVPEDKRVELGEDHPYLCDLLRTCSYEISYNEFQFQKLDKNVKSCGRWCCLRCLLKDMDLYDFQRFFLSLYGDDIVTALTTKTEDLK